MRGQRIVIEGKHRVASGQCTAQRFEQIGQSWVAHRFLALSANYCEPDCLPTNGQHLGVHCSTTNSALITATQAYLGPKSEVDASTGSFTFPFTGSGMTGDPRSVTTPETWQALLLAVGDAYMGAGTMFAQVECQGVKMSGAAWCEYKGSLTDAQKKTRTQMRNKRSRYVADFREGMGRRAGMTDERDSDLPGIDRR